MKTGQEIEAYIREALALISHRPLMCGGTAEGVDLLLWNYYGLLTFIHHRDGDYTSIRDEVYGEEGCGSASFPSHYRRERPVATEAETAVYVLEQWRKIGQRLGFPLDSPDY
jgi:hypothetical protein